MATKSTRSLCVPEMDRERREMNGSHKSTKANAVPRRAQGRMFVERKEIRWGKDHGALFSGSKGEDGPF